MKRYEISDEYRTGNDRIDQQHAKMLDYTWRAHELFTDENMLFKADDIRKILEGLDRLFHDPMMPFRFNQEKSMKKPADVRDQLTMNLKTMFFAKNLIELYLIYIRHLAKAEIKEA